MLPKIVKIYIDLNSGEHIGESVEVEFSIFNLPPGTVWVPSKVFMQDKYQLPETEVVDGEIVAVDWYNPVESVEEEAQAKALMDNNGESVYSTSWE